MSNAEKKNIILVLPSWYPHKLSPFEGDFIQRQVQAISKVQQQVVIFVVKDGAGKFTSNVLIEKTTSQNLVEITAYYKPLSTGIKLVDKIISQYKYKKVYKKLLQQFIQENGVPALCHVHVAIKAGLLALYLQKNKGVPYIVTEHWSGYYKQSQPNVYTGNWWLNRLNKTVLKKAAMLITVSDNLGQAIHNNFVQVPYTVIHNVVDTGVFYQTNFTPSRFRFIHPSGLLPVKNPEGILEACHIIKQKGYNFELLMLGAEAAAMQQLAAAKGLLNTEVFFKGEVPYTDVAKEMQQSSALLMFSRFETLSCVTQEALCCGLPVICAAVGGVPELVTQQNGSLVQSENISQLAAAMMHMIDNYPRYNKQQIAMDAMAKFNYTVIADEYVKLYKRFLL